MIFIIGILVIVVFTGWAICRAGALADKRIEKLMKMKEDMDMSNKLRRGEM